jgi:hypothetical protein
VGVSEVLLTWAVMERDAAGGHREMWRSSIGEQHSKTFIVMHLGETF